MSDTVKLIIEIPKEAYNVLLTEQVLPPHIDVEWLLIHGIPLDDVKADIQRTITASWYNGENYKKNYRDGLDNALKIIDKHLADIRGE